MNSSLVLGISIIKYRPLLRSILILINHHQYHLEKCVGASGSATGEYASKPKRSIRQRPDNSLMERMAYLQAKNQ